MEDKKKNKGRIIFRYVFLFFLIAFTALYLSEATGYFEFEQHKKVEITNDKIKEFEQDVSMGKNINIKDYINETDISYTNLASNTGYKLSSSIENILENGLEETFNFLNSFFGNR